MEYCHLHCVAHRDLKLDNTLLDDSNPPVIKLCDFGFAKTWTDDANMYTHIGCVQLSNCKYRENMQSSSSASLALPSVEQRTFESARTWVCSFLGYLQTIVSR